MEFKSKIDTEIAELYKRLNDLNKLREEEKKAFLAAKTGEGWHGFEFFSSYYGSHDEYGEGDFTREFLLSPAVSGDRWSGVQFAHGHRGQNATNDEFENWISALADDQYIEL